MTIKVNQAVQTPNGPGVVQGQTWGENGHVILVAHKPDAQIDLSKVQSAQGDGRGSWILCGYLPEQVEAK